MVPRDERLPFAAYPPRIRIPPLPDDNDVTMLQETLTRTAVRQTVPLDETRQQVQTLANHSAAVHQRTEEQISHVQRQHNELANKTAEYLQMHHDQQDALRQQQEYMKHQQEEMRQQMEEHRQYIAEQYRLLKEAQEAVGVQGQTIKSLAEAVRPQNQARWSAFAQGDDAVMNIAHQETAPAVTVVQAGVSGPTPPMYRGCTKQDKRAFMDSYMVYQRRVRALNQNEQVQVRLTPLGACIEQSTMVRICDTELFKAEMEVTKAEWRDYFLSARQPDHTANKKLEQAVSSMRMDTSLQDAQSRIARMRSDFYAILNQLNMEDIMQQDPKVVVGYLIEALRPTVFKASVKDQLGRPRYKLTRSNMQTFLKWLRPELETFMKYEPHISSVSNAAQTGGNKNNNKGNQKSTPPEMLKSGVKEATAGNGKQSGTDLPKQHGGHQNSKGNERKNNGGDGKACFKCGDLTHGVFQCPDIANASEAKMLYEQRTGRKVMKPVAAVAHNSEGAPSGSAAIPCTVNDTVKTFITPDTGAEVSVVASTLLDKLKKRGMWLTAQNLPEATIVAGIGEQPLAISTKVMLDLRFSTPGGPLVLQNVVCWVVTQQLPNGLGELLLSRPVMERLGYSSERLLHDAQQAQQLYDLADVDGGCNTNERHVFALVTETDPLQPTEEEQAMQDDEAQACFPTPETDVSEDVEEVRRILMDKVEDARKNGASEDYISSLRPLLEKFIDVFRLTLGRDPPVDMPPMEITLKNGAVPVRCRARRYSQEHREFLQSHVRQLLDGGLCYRNPKSRWCSPPHIVKKPGVRKYRMTVDVRGPNACVEPIAWPMPILEVILERLRLSKYFFLVDFFKGFLQFAMAEHCQEIYSILTEEGVITPTRVLMGGTNSVAYVQSTVQAMFEELFNKGLLGWIDDLLGYADSEINLLQILTRMLEICEEKGLKLNPEKSFFFVREALWCGRIVSGAGVRHDPARIEALTRLPTPTTGQELQQFLCALNWMRQSLPAFNKLVQPLMDFMERVYEQGGGRSKTHVRKVVLNDLRWGPTEDAALDQCKEALSKALQLSHPDPKKRLCVFTDASEKLWGAALTQVSREQLHRPLSEQDHEPLMMLSGTFSGAAQRWAIVEKEAYTIVETCRRADYLLHRRDGFALYTDHRNLRYIFDPHGVSNGVPKYTADKLHRWALLLMAYTYEIYDISGEANVWADLLSRWGSSFKTVCAISRLPMPLSPQLDDHFVWPTVRDIALAQECVAPPTGMQQSAEDKLWRDSEDRVWIPDDAVNLALRICIVGHFGAAGHRSSTATLSAISQRFVWTGQAKDVSDFVRRCLHCASAVGGPPQPRLLGEALHADKPNELIHWDYLYMGKSDKAYEYVLVIKDDASKFVWLLPCTAATADNTYNHLLDWFASFGVCRSWVSDQGTHFKNKVIEALQHALGAHHHFTSAESCSRCLNLHGLHDQDDQRLLPLVCRGQYRPQQGVPGQTQYVSPPLLHLPLPPATAATAPNLHRLTTQRISLPPRTSRPPR